MYCSRKTDVRIDFLAKLGAEGSRTIRKTFLFGKHESTSDMSCVKYIYICIKIYAPILPHKCQHATSCHPPKHTTQGNIYKTHGGARAKRAAIVCFVAQIFCVDPSSLFVCIWGVGNTKTNRTMTNNRMFTQNRYKHRVDRPTLVWQMIKKYDAIIV